MADFGFSSEATSGSLKGSGHGRGHDGYRPPEVLKEESQYNNKADIWAMGCILYELAVGRKAFSNDWATWNYTVSQGINFEIPLDENFSDACKVPIAKNITRMLAIDPQSRPSATSFVDEFKQNFQITQSPARQYTVVHQELSIDRSDQDVADPNTLNESIHGSDPLIRE